MIIKRIKICISEKQGIQSTDNILQKFNIKYFILLLMCLKYA